jgi:hypothetical protein
VTAISPSRRAVRRTLVPSISTNVASKGGSIRAPTVNWSSAPA